jgi:hypothetical protein
VRVIRVLVELRDGISDIAGSRESDAVREAIDIEFIQSQVDSGVYEWEDCKRLIGAVVSIIRRVQAPKRDKETQDRWEVVRSNMLDPDADRPRELCKSLEFLLDRVNMLRIDAANAR